MKVLSAGMAALLVVLAVGAAFAAAGRLGTRPVSRVQGLMPEVIVAAEMPRLVMPTVEVQALRTVAGLGTQSQFLGGIGLCPASQFGN